MKAKARVLRIDPFHKIKVNEIVDVEHVMHGIWELKGPRGNPWGYSDKVSHDSLGQPKVYPVIRLIAGTGEGSPRDPVEVLDELKAKAKSSLEDEAKARAGGIDHARQA